MKTLAIETSGRFGSIAIWESNQCLAEKDLPHDRRTAESLIIGIEDLISGCHWSPADLELIAVTQGPGSFTGLRLGCVTAKVLAYAVGAKLVGVNTLEVLASPAMPGTPLWSAMEAGRNQCFVAQFSVTKQGPTETTPALIMEIEEWLKILTAGDRITGPLLQTVRQRLPAGVETLPVEHWSPHARHVAQLGVDKYRQGHVENLWEFSPHYFRPSAAEEKRSVAGQHRGNKPK